MSQHNKNTNSPVEREVVMQKAVALRQHLLRHDAHVELECERLDLVCERACNVALRHEEQRRLRLGRDA